MSSAQRQPSETVSINVMAQWLIRKVKASRGKILTFLAPPLYLLDCRLLAAYQSLLLATKPESLPAGMMRLERHAWQ